MVKLSGTGNSGKPGGSSVSGSQESWRDGGVAVGRATSEFKLCHLKAIP